MHVTQTLPTKMLRVRADIAEMMSAIHWHARGKQVADILDPLVRPEIERRFAALPEGDVKQRALDRIAALLGDPR